MRDEDIKSSDKRFPDGANYRIEVSGIETADILKAVIDEAKKQGIPIHRAIATVRGSACYSDEQLKELAKVAAENEVEVIICPGKLAQAVFDDPNRILSGLNWQNTEEADAYTREILRCVKIGFRGFLVWRKGMLRALNFRRKFDIPPETIFKLSTFDNNANVYDFSLAEKSGADTINTANGLSLKSLSEIRRNINVPLDIHMTFWQLAFEKNESGRLELTAKPYDRIDDAPEIVRVAGPCYFKFEAGTPGLGVYDLSGPDWTLKDLAEHKRKDVRTAAQVVRRVKEKYPGLVLSDWGPKDLRVPREYPDLSFFTKAEIRAKRRFGGGEKATA